MHSCCKNATPNHMFQLLRPPSGRTERASIEREQDLLMALGVLDLGGALNLGLRASGFEGLDSKEGQQNFSQRPLCESVMVQPHISLGAPG